MIQLLDALLRDLVVNAVPGIVSSQHVRFQPPDGEMRNYVRNVLKKPALNFFLADIRDNRKLRSNDVARRVERGESIAEPMADRVDCHYLVTAWRPEQAVNGNDPTPEEHALLYATLARFLHEGSLNPTRHYGAGTAEANAWPAAVRETDLPTTIPTTDGFQRFAELWHGMGQAARWKPALHLIVTLPVLRDPIPEGPMVTTQITEYRVRDSAAVDRWIQIGGQVTNARELVDGRPSPVANAWVGITLPPSTSPFAESLTDARGRFLLGWSLQTWPDTVDYQIRTVAEGLGETQIPVTLPSRTGEYDLSFS